MARLLIAGLLGAAAITPLLAQPAVVRVTPVVRVAPVAPMAPMARMATTMTRADVQARIQAQFARRDANHDGFLTADELAMGGGMHGDMAEMHGGMHGDMDGDKHGDMAEMHGPGAMGDPGAMFDRLDANHDGQISRDEFARGHQMRIEKRIVINREPGQPGDMHGMRGMNHGGGMMGADMLKRADANHDGRVSLSEATNAALQHFDMLDTNHDGRITPEERAAGRQRMMQMRMQKHAAG